MPHHDESPGPSDDTRLGPYRIIREIGRGGQATVYLADDPRLHRHVALKVLDPGRGVDQTRLERFRREAEITSKLDHPGICAVYETGEDRGTLWIAMRYVEGESLANRISTGVRRRSKSEPSALTEPTDGKGDAPRRPGSEAATPPGTSDEIEKVLLIFEETARALHVAHELGVIHRDIKPGNIMVADSGEPVILDFGLAQEVSGDQPPLTITGDIMGTPAYMSPEQIAAQRIPLDRRTDVYSLAVSLFECLTLRRPFDAPTREGLYQAIMTKGPADIRRLNPAVSNEIRIILVTALDKDRDRRYLTALDLAEDLRRVRCHEPIAAQAPSALRRISSWARRNRGLAASLAALFLCLVGGLITVSVFYGTASRALAEKERALAERERLADIKLATDLIDGVAELRPFWPEAVSGPKGMDAWLSLSADLMGRAAIDRARLTSLLGADAVKAAIGPDTRPAEEAKAAWSLARDELSWVDALTLDLLRKAHAVELLIPRVEQRKRFALEVDEKTWRDHAADWDRAIRAISDRVDHPQYAGLSITRQRGLIPLGPDPVSKLEEFAVHGTGKIPPRDPGEGTLEISDDSCIVLVLIPGGAFTMGSPASEPGHEDDETEHPVSLDPFFIGKHEITQAQAPLMFDGVRVASYYPGRKAEGPPITDRHPTEFVTWYEALDMCRRFGLTLPTEAQWEYACRARTTTAYAFGPSAAALEGAENVFDRSAAEVDPTHQGPDSAKWKDGYPYHSPVGAFRPNPFGLWDMHGNVQEWCVDFYDQLALAREDHRPGDGLIIAKLTRSPESAYRSARGGSLNFGTTLARSAARSRWEPGTRNHQLGFRVTRPVLR